MVQTLLVAVLLIGAGPVRAFDSCVKKPPAGFKYVKSVSGVEHFVSEKKDLSLTIKCYGEGFHIADVKKKFGNEIEVKTLRDKVEYFDLNAEGVLTRTYLVETPQTLNQLTFITDIHLVRSVQGLNDRILAWLKE